MKFVRYYYGGGEQLGVLTAQDGVFPLDESGVGPFSGMIDLIERISERELALLRSAAQGGVPVAAVRLAEVRLLSPIGRPIHDIICAGVNYQTHLAESAANLKNFAKDSGTTYFGKRAAEIYGPGPIPARLDLDESLDYEAELAVIIGRTGRDIPRELAENYIFGYSVFNDLSSRALQTRHQQWYKGKSLDGYAAMGPCLLHKSALPFPVETNILCAVNGETRQSANTRELICDIPGMISELSAGMTLEAGDIIATGTPSGVGMGFNPPRYLKRGDEVICEIPEIGRLVNRIV